MNLPVHFYPDARLKLLCIACEVLARPLYWSASQSPHQVDVRLVEKGQHNHPACLRGQLQEQIHAASSAGYDAVVLGYGLCGRATAGLVAAGIPLVIPRAHDCITLFLGSRQRYLVEFARCPGTFWYSRDYMERQAAGDSTAALGLGSAGEIQAEYDRFVEKYGRENADYLVEVMGAWAQHYQRAVFLASGLGDDSQAQEEARRQADRRGWMFEMLAMDLSLLHRLLAGDWDADFLVLKPGESILETHDESILKSSGWQE